MQKSLRLIPLLICMYQLEILPSNVFSQVMLSILCPQLKQCVNRPSRNNSIFVFYI